MRDMPTVAIVDDDESVRDTTKDLLDSAGTSAALTSLAPFAIAVLCFTASSGTWSNFASEFTGATGGIAGFFAALGIRLVYDAA